MTSIDRLRTALARTPEVEVEYDFDHWVVRLKDPNGVWHSAACEPSTDEAAAIRYALGLAAVQRALTED